MAQTFLNVLTAFEGTYTKSLANNVIDQDACKATLSLRAYNLHGTV